MLAVPAIGSAGGRQHGEALSVESGCFLSQPRQAFPEDAARGGRTASKTGSVRQGVPPADFFTKGRGGLEPTALRGSCSCQTSTAAAIPPGKGLLRPSVVEPAGPVVPDPLGSISREAAHPWLPIGIGRGHEIPHAVSLDRRWKTKNKARPCHGTPDRQQPDAQPGSKRTA
jgi:hypothetical protein